MDNKDGTMPFLEHLTELRDRLIKCSVAVGIGFAICYGFQEKLFEILTRPLIQVMGKGDTLIFTGLPEAFFTYMKVAFFAGLMLASPVILYHFWKFVAPGLLKEEKRTMLPLILLSSLFFIGGSLFGYFIVFPFGFQFFLSFSNEHIQAMPSMKEYLSFAIAMLLAFGAVFELPLILTGMARLGLITPEFLRKNRKYAILIIFIVAAILTPPDVVTQIMMAIPLMMLYEISILGAVIFQRKPLTAEDDDQKEAEGRDPGGKEGEAVQTEETQSPTEKPPDEEQDEKIADEGVSDEDRKIQAEAEMRQDEPQSPGIDGEKDLKKDDGIHTPPD
jgi:sec-independent protein translocase protein TatC